MHHLMYVSAAIRNLDLRELDNILVTSQRNNAAEAVTGMLLFIDGSFMQILEGTEADVLGVYARIAADWRHDGLRVLLDQPCRERLFPDWTMGVDRVLPALRARPGVFEVTRVAIEQTISPERALEIAVFLRTFYLVNRRRHSA